MTHYDNTIKLYDGGRKGQKGGRGRREVERKEVKEQKGREQEAIGK